MSYVPVIYDNGSIFIEKYTCGDCITVDITFTCLGHYFYEQLLCMKFWTKINKIKVSRYTVGTYNLYTPIYLLISLKYFFKDCLEVDNLRLVK